jgi:lipoyl(octanoyl) transferase
MEAAVIDLLGAYGIRATGSADAPGVYVGSSKIAALGLRITRGACYHGLALNVDMDLAPFHLIDPCGYPGLAVTQLRDFGVTEPAEVVAGKLARNLMERLA